MTFNCKNFSWRRWAYILGHLLVWTAVILVNYDPKISPFAILLIFWPVAVWQFGDVGFLKFTGIPDRLHFHQLVMISTKLVIRAR